MDQLLEGVALLRDRGVVLLAGVEAGEVGLLGGEVTPQDAVRCPRVRAPREVKQVLRVLAAAPR